jgi:hypothetical protein
MPKDPLRETSDGCLLIKIGRLVRSRRQGLLIGIRRRLDQAVRRR